ncbi:prolyl oligopeptidase family serine peptidase [Phenylobacterium sp.]|jgi:prolyl oligopeptidase|uniref:prolyl oligopeptidase family serine peptidase n=1 Tax=Phenylobacterium sp. TaxID=1871053 RepID=UPI002F93ED7C
MKSLAATLVALAVSVPALAQDADPYIWLEEVDAPRAMQWVEAENARTADRLERDPRYKTFLDEARAIFTATDRIPVPHFRAGGVDNLWQDAAHPNGVWRHATLASYRSATPAWETILDVDALAKAEGKRWFYKGAACLKPAETTCLVRLSNGGGDAVEVREFDTRTKRFLDGGFRFPEGKQYVEWLDPQSLIVGREWTPGELTQSGYPMVLKIVSRSGQAKEVFRGQKSDVWAQPIVLRGEGGRTEGVVVQRGLTFYESEYSLLTDKGLVRIPLPRKAQQQDYVDGQVVFTLQEAWGGFQPGALIAYDLAALKAGTAKPQLIFQPGPRQAIQQVAATDGRLAVVLLDDVKGAVDVWDHVGGRWTAKRMPLPRDANITLVDASPKDDQLFVNVEGFLIPNALWLADGASGAAARVKALPPRFKPDTHLVEQFWATSSDGAKIPYFVVRPKAAKLDGSIPTLMYGYGGFEVAKPPIYMPEAGKLWMERGGAYVIANIRGGGEFGPAWHQAVLREKRQLAFDDFAAVARDLTARKITSPRRLGIYGRSNGGVLTSVSMTQHPELWNAVVIESPLIDMLRYHKLSAGASWVGEYGDPDVPEDRAFIARYSGYQNLKAGVRYPEAYITTNTRDDRVHPGHARKYAARLKELGAPYLYYEQTFGGHANDADPELNARRWARHYVYLAQKLMD